MAQARKTQGLPTLVVALRHAAGQVTNAQNEALSLGHGNGATGIKQVERMRSLQHLLVGGQRQIQIDQIPRLLFTDIEPGKQRVDICVFEIVA